MNPEKQEEAFKRIEKLYSKKKSLLEGMLGLTSKRAGLDESERPEEILSLIEDRQVLINTIDGLDEEIHNLTNSSVRFSGDKVDSGNLPDYFALAWAKIQEQKNSCLNLIEQIQLLDRQQGPKLELQLVSLKKQQEKLRVSKKTVEAYRRKPPLPESVFIDKKK